MPSRQFKVKKELHRPPAFILRVLLLTAPLSPGCCAQQSLSCSALTLPPVLRLVPAYALRPLSNHGKFRGLLLDAWSMHCWLIVLERWEWIARASSCW